MKAVILAAGQGVRLAPLTDKKPKPMIQLAGKPILEHLINNLNSNGVKEFVLVVGFKQEQIRNHFGFGHGSNLKFEYVTQSSPMGTGHALKMAEDYLSGDFILAYGDLLLSKYAIRAVIQAHELGESTLGVVKVSKPESYGMVELRGECVNRIVEKPRRTSAATYLVNAGIYFFNERILDCIKKTELSERSEFELTDAINLLIRGGSKVRATPLPEESWMDIGRPWDVIEANRRLLEQTQGSVKLGRIEKNVAVSAPVFVGSGSVIRFGSIIEGPVWIGEGSEVGPLASLRPFTSIGKNVRIGSFCELKNTVVMDHTHIPHMSYFGDSVIGERCNFGAGTITANLRFDQNTVKVKVRGRIVDSGLRKLGAIVGDDVQTGINVSLMPGVKIPSEAWIPPGTVVRRDIEEYASGHKNTGRHR